MISTARTPVPTPKFSPKASSPAAKAPAKVASAVCIIPRVVFSNVALDVASIQHLHEGMCWMSTSMRLASTHTMSPSIAAQAVLS